MVEVRIATPADARAIAIVHVDAWRWAYRGLLPAEMLESLDVDQKEREWSEWLTRRPDDPVGTMVAEIDGALVGFCGFGPNRDQDEGKRTAEIMTLYRLEAAAHRGVGRALLRAAGARLRELGYVDATLWVYRDNDSARRFYEVNGWATDGTTGMLELDGVIRPIVRYRAPLST